MSAKKQLEFSLRSIANIGAIKLHIAAGNPDAANKVVESVFFAADRLMDFPMLGHVGRRLGTRELVLPKFPYTIIYRLTLKRSLLPPLFINRARIQNDMRSAPRVVTPKIKSLENA